jgi:UDP-N-acetylmuramate dehydrogenase
MKLAELDYLRKTYGSRLQVNTSLARYTSARIGGPADASIISRSSTDLAEIVLHMWEKDIKFVIIGGGSNLLMSDKGMRELLIINRARESHFDDSGKQVRLIAESGTSMNDLAQKASRFGLGGLEWAGTIPGSLGGAVYGNAGAFGGNMAGNLVSVDIISQIAGRETWQVEKLEYAYRSSILKKDHEPVVILAASLALVKSSPEAVKQKMESNSARRRSSQPPGASMGSIFRNPPGDFAGRLIENSGLKGKRVGNAEVSPVHANFIVNHGQTLAGDVLALIKIIQSEVERKFGIALELEIELAGEW